MASLSPDQLNAVLANSPDTSMTPAASPWTQATADRILRTTAIPVSLNPGQNSWAPWTKITAAYSAVSPPDPATGQQYFCLVGAGNDGLGVRFDFALNPAAVPGTPSSSPGLFSPQPEFGGIAGYSGWTYVIDPSSGQHYFLCAISSTTAGTPNALYWVCLTEPYKLLMPFLKPYQPKSGVVEPQGLWSTGETLWFTNSDGRLWQVALSDVLANTSGSLQQVSSTGTVQAVVSDGGSNPTYYVLSAVPNGSSYDLVEFPAGAPGNAVTIQSGCSLGGIKTTPDGAIWKVIPDLNPLDVQKPNSEVALLVPTFPTNGLTPTWVDPFANADPSLYPTGFTQTIMDAVPLSATNILLCTTANSSSYFPNDVLPPAAWELTRVGIGILDQPAVPFPSYSGDELTAYTDISKALIAAQSDTYDIRAEYGAITAAQASSYYTNLKTLSVPGSFNDTAAWNVVQADLTAEMYNLVSALSFWESTTDLVSLQNQIQTTAAGYVSNSLAIPTTATPISSTAGTVSALNIVGFTSGSGGTILTAVAGILACTSPAGAAVVGVLAAGAALVSFFCSFFASRSTDFVIDVSDPMYYISAKLGEIDGTIGLLFTETITIIQSTSQACAKDPGKLAAVGGLFRNGTWLNSPPNFEPGSNQPPQSFEAYYQGCVLSFLQAFVPLVTAANVMELNPPQGEWPTYKGKPVYVSPTHQFWDTWGNEYNGALLQYASSHDQSKPLGQDLDALLFTTWNLSTAEVFLTWKIPGKPGWVS